MSAKENEFGFKHLEIEPGRKVGGCQSMGGN